LFQLCIEATNQQTVLLEGLEAVSNSIIHLAVYETLLWDKQKKEAELNHEVKASMTAACLNIIEFQARAICLMHLNQLESVIRNAFKWDGWDKLLLAIEKAETMLRGCAERQDWLESKESRDHGLKKERRQEMISLQKEENQFLQLLFKNGCHYSETIARNRKRVVGTCDWFTNHESFQEWDCPNENQERNLLYVTADPGCGKSVLSAYLIDEILPDDGRTVCYFFFKDDFENQKRPLAALCSLLHQIFTENPSALTEDILKKYRAQGDLLVKSFTDMWTIFIAAAANQETVCVIDALDECAEADTSDGQPGRNRLIEAITSVGCGSDQRHNLKFLLTSRPYSHIRKRIVPAPNSTAHLIHLQGDSDSTANEIAAEIKVVMKQRLEQTAKDFDLTTDERILLEEQLGATKNRTYLWLTLVFDGLIEKTYITKKDIMGLTKRLPQGIYDAYERILGRSKNQEKTRTLLHIIVGAKRPLSLSEVSVALAIYRQQSWDDVEMEIIPENRIRDAIRDICGLFITVVDERVYLLHQTAREFLIRGVSNEFLSKIWQHSIDIATSNSVLTEICISSLHPDFVKENLPIFEYAAIHWGDHYRLSTETCMMTMAEIARDLCLYSQTRTQWIYRKFRVDYMPPLCVASALGLNRAVELFLHEQDVISKASVDSKDSEYGQTPLVWAARCGHEAVVKQLIATGQADVDARNLYGTSALSMAASRGYEGVVKQLLATGKVDINLRDADYDATPLMWAAEYGYEAVVKQLLATGQADINAKDKIEGRSALSWAARNGHAAVVKLLLATGNVDVDSNDNSDRTPLSGAARNGHAAVVKLLLATGKVDVNSKGKAFDRTPLLRAAESGHEAVVQLLLATGNIDVESADNTGRTPLSWAAENGHEAVVKLLLATGKVDVDSKDNSGRTTLSWAAMGGYKAVVKLLLATGKVDIDSKDNSGQTPLSWAAGEGHDAKAAARNWHG
jgi:ankyrin repeat protein